TWRSRRRDRRATASSRSARRGHSSRSEVQSFLGSASQRSALPEAVTIAGCGRESRRAMNEFLQRLKQRKLVQWAVAYVAAAFALLQGIDIVAQQFGWPEGVRRGITLALVVGFFVMLVLAWYHGERGVERVTGTELLILALVLALGGGFLWRFARASRRPNDTIAAVSSLAPLAISNKSIAVLPFENRSEDKANAYFTDGVQDEILTDLAKIADLKVISRTSVLQYKSGVARNLREIAQQLGVANV